MGTLGVQEMIIIFLVALVLFGPKKLPELGRTIGKAITEFRRASSDLKATFEREMQTLERESESLKDSTRQFAAEIEAHTNYDYPYYESGSYAHDSYHDSATNPSTVSVAEVPGAESQGLLEAASQVDVAESEPQIEGTVPRSETVVADAPQPEQNQAAETPQHS